MNINNYRDYLDNKRLIMVVLSTCMLPVSYTSLFRLCVSQFFVFLFNFVVQYRSLCTLQSRSLVFIKPRETIAPVYFYVWYIHFLVCHYLHIVHHVSYDCLREIYNRLDTTTGLKGKLTSWWMVSGGWWLLLGDI